MTDLERVMSHVENLICRVINITLESPGAREILKTLNPLLDVPPTLPFMRMRYSEAIDWLREKGIKNEEGNDYTFGDDM